MDNYSTTLDSNLGNSQLDLTHEAISYLKTTATWSTFFAILGFIGVGFMVILALFMGTIMSMMPGYSELGTAMPGVMGGLFTIIYLVMAVLYFFPTLYLYRFATKTKKAIKNYETVTLTDAFKNLKNSFQFMGIMIAIILGLYVILLLVALLGVLAA